MLSKIIDKFRRKKIIDYAIAKGCDHDGDIVVYKGVSYIVYLVEGLVCRVNPSK